jgi:predicted DNA-binding transcriptional regulator YafY
MTAKEYEKKAEDILNGIDLQTKGLTPEETAAFIATAATAANAYATLAVSKRIGELRHWLGGVREADLKYTGRLT